MYLKRRGFTLIELLVVIAIIGILATIGLLSFGQYSAKARDSQRKNDLGLMQRALLGFGSDAIKFPVFTTTSPIGVNNAKAGCYATTADGDKIASRANWDSASTSSGTGQNLQDQIGKYFANNRLPIDPLNKCNEKNYPWEGKSPYVYYADEVSATTALLGVYLENSKDQAGWQYNIPEYNTYATSVGLNKYDNYTGAQYSAKVSVYFRGLKLTE